MHSERTQKQIITAAVICTLIVQLFCSGSLNMLADALTTPEALAWLLFMETGRKVTVFHTPEAEKPPDSTLSPLLPQDTQEQITQAVFSPQDAQTVEVVNYCGYSIDPTALLAQSLSWDLTQDAPTVLIVHSHATESYTKTENYQETSTYRTLDTDYNVISIGTQIARQLEAGGITVLHDRTLHDYPSYTDAYNSARQSIQDYLTQYPSIRLVLDIHRDAVEGSAGQQISYTVDTDAGQAAQVMLVVGTDANGLTHPQWDENMALAVKLHAQLEKNTPGICRPISFRKQRFNQDLSTGALLLEMGAAGNTRQEALLAADLVAQSILDLAYGSTMEPV